MTLTSAVRGVNTDNVLEVAVTDSEGTILDLAWHVVVATDKIVSVFTVVGRSDAVVACLEAELITTNESKTALSRKTERNKYHTCSSCALEFLGRP